MDDSKYLEEEVTRSNFAFLSNHYLDVKGSMGLFRDKSTVQDLSAIDHKESTQQFYHSKTSSKLVFDRLIQDSNRRSYATKKIEDYRLMLELEYENSLLSQPRFNKSAQEELVSRLMLDSQRRQRNKEVIQKFKSEQESLVESFKIPLEQTTKIVARLAVDSRSKYLQRESLYQKIKDKAIMILDKIRTQKHPKRKLDPDVIQRITSTSPNCKHTHADPRPSSKSLTKSSLKEVLDRLHKKSPLKIYIPYSPSPKKKPSRTKSARKPITNRSNLEDDDYYLRLKASGITRKN